MCSSDLICPTPSFPIYESMINYTGAKAVPIDLLETKNFSIDPNKVLSLINNKTRLIILNNPQNPTGGFIVFFFSSGRRHTRLVRDWSSDVCSSDLAAGVFPVMPDSFDILTFSTFLSFLTYSTLSLFNDICRTNRNF